jgi:hypothetical protein
MKSCIDIEGLRARIKLCFDLSLFGFGYEEFLVPV